MHVLVYGSIVIKAFIKFNSLYTFSKIKFYVSLTRMNQAKFQLLEPLFLGHWTTEYHWKVNVFVILGCITSLQLNFKLGILIWLGFQAFKEAERD